MHMYYLYLYRLSPWLGWTGFLPCKLLIEEDTLGFDWGKGPKSYPEKRPVCRRISKDGLTERPEADGCRNRHLLDFHQSPFGRVAALNTTGYQTNPPWVAIPGNEVPAGKALALSVATVMPRWGGWDFRVVMHM